MINGNAFEKCSSLTTITIPKSVGTIGMYSFDGCSQLNEIIFNEGLKTIETYAFQNSVIIQIIIPSTVTSLDATAFYNCNQLQSITVTEGNQNFANYKNDGILYDKAIKNIIIYPKGNLITSIVIPETIISIGSYVFSSCNNINTLTLSSIKSIGSFAFYSCTGIQTVTFSNSLETLSESSFQLCTSLTSVTIPATVKEIGKSAFYQCGTISSLTINNGVGNINAFAFHSCVKLTSVTIPSSINTINEGAFYGCKQISQLIIEKGVVTIGKEAFCQCTSLKSISIPTVTINNNAFASCSNLETIILEEGVKHIQDLVFQLCVKLKSVTIPTTVSLISTNPFFECSSLESIKVTKGNTAYSNYNDDGVLYNNVFTTLLVFPINSPHKTYVIPNSVTNIESYSFQSSKIESISIGENVITIKSYAFYSCKSLKCIYYYGKTKPTMEENVFQSVPATKVMVLDRYEGDTTFGNKQISKTAIDGCNTMSTFPFTSSCTYSPTSSFTGTNTYSQTNTFTKSNSFTMSNTFYNSKTYTKSNTYFVTFTKSNTYKIETSNDIEQISQTTLTYTLIRSQTISVHTMTFINSFTISMINSSYTHIKTMFIYYEYTVFDYTFLYSYYSNFFTINIQNQENKEGNNLFIIIAVCASVAVVMVIVIVAVILIRNRNKNAILVEEKIESLEDNGVETIRDFSLTGPQFSNVKEDPFADDFNEDESLRLLDESNKSEDDS
ncbi:leucine-rich repeat protein [Histomonas meleagridis]|uniref:leucine-rich repeat protein n=1 Tax=Histomonas meleagridis TaxID=135588 RepID=UPI00355995DA|nr:leucine-rich repeat protein [Histomonas meleagridis]KAH0802903.1 leucine-rich repeat protein [Histomonas meleagridis]